MARNTEIEIRKENPKFPKNLFLLLPKLPFNRKRSVEVVIEKEPNQKLQFANGGGGDDDQEGLIISSSNKDADVVKFSEPRPVVPPPLKLDADDSTGRTSNRIVLWQVYAIGGFFLLKWVWARWKERKEMGAKKESSDDDEQPPPTDDESQYA